MGRKDKKGRRSCRAKAAAYAKEKDANTFGYLNLPEGAEEFKVQQGGGTMKLDCIPYEVQIDGNPHADAGEVYFKRDFLVHKNVGADEKGKGGRTFICLKTFNKPCPCCDKRDEMANDPDYTDEEVKALKPKKRQLFNLIDRKNPDTIKVMDFSYHLFGKLLKQRLDGADEDDEYDRFVELEEGMILKVYFEEKKFGTAVYYDATSIDFKDRPDDYDDELIDEAHDLDSMLIELSPAEIKKILRGLDEDPSDDDEEEDEKPAKKSKEPKARSRRNKKKDDDDDDNEEDDKEEPEEDEDEKPKSKRGGRRGSRKAEKEEPEVNDDDDDDDDNDENEKPKSKRGSRRGSRKAEKEEPEDNDDDDNEDEDEKPKSRRGSRRGSKKDKKEEPEDNEDDNEDEDEKPKSKRGSRRGKKEEKKSCGKCPHGHKFGEDTDVSDDCEECDIWTECMKKYEEE